MPYKIGRKKGRTIGAPNKEPEKRVRPRKVGVREQEALAKGFMDVTEASMDKAEQTIKVKEFNRRRRAWQCDICGILMETHNRARHIDLHYIRREIDDKDLAKYKNPDKFQKVKNSLAALEDKTTRNTVKLNELTEKNIIEIDRVKRIEAQFEDKMAEVIKKKDQEIKYLRRDNDSLMAKQELMEAELKSLKDKMALIISIIPGLTKSS